MPELVAGFMILVGIVAYAFTDKMIAKGWFQKHGLDDEGIEQLKKNYQIRAFIVIILGVLGLIIIRFMQSR